MYQFAQSNRDSLIRRVPHAKNAKGARNAQEISSSRSSRPWRSWRAIFIPLLLLLLLLPACRRQPAADEAADVQVVLTPGPDSLAVGPITFDLTLWDANGRPIDGAAPVTLRGDMNHAGMKPVLAEATGSGDGLYTADFEWTMAGDWTVSIEATLPDGRVKRATFPFTVEAVEADE
jgi:hypothetical protein